MTVGTSVMAVENRSFSLQLYPFIVTFGAVTTGTEVGSNRRVSDRPNGHSSSSSGAYSSRVADAGGSLSEELDCSSRSGHIVASARPRENDGDLCTTSRHYVVTRAVSMLTA